MAYTWQLPAFSPYKSLRSLVVNGIIVNAMSPFSSDQLFGYPLLFTARTARESCWGLYRNDLKDLCASGELAKPLAARPLSRIRPPRMLGVLAQKAQI